MHIQEFPEELLVLILEMCLLLSPADFFDETRAQNVGYRRISLNIPPACDILLVCKQWARIGTPMLYSSLLLVSRRHAAKVAPYLKNNQHVAERITYMRISGRYSRELLSVARCAPNVKAVCVFPPFDPTPSGTENLSEILSILDPESLYIGHLGSSMIAPFVQQSTTLESIHFLQYASVAKDVKDAITGSRSLRKLTFSDFPVTFLSARDDWWVRMVHNSGVERLVFLEASDSQRKRFEDQFARYPGVLNLVTFQ